MEQTPVHEQHNVDLLTLIPSEVKTLVEIGCSSGALAREYKKINRHCHYIGVDIVPEYVKLAKRFCDTAIALDIETADSVFLREKLSSECWIFADSLEHLRDPWALLSKIRKIIPANGCIVACIPNAQHWSVQARLSIGDFRYQDMGLLDKTHLRWFTRATIVEMFENAGFQIVAGKPRILDEPDREKFLPLIHAMASSLGVDADLAVSDAIPFQHVVKAVPVGACAPAEKSAGVFSSLGAMLRGAKR